MVFSSQSFDPPFLHCPVFFFVKDYFIFSLTFIVTILPLCNCVFFAKKILLILCAIHNTVHYWSAFLVGAFHFLFVKQIIY